MTASARDQILGRIRQSLGRGELAGEAREAARRHIAEPAPNLVPARGRVPRPQRTGVFIKWAALSGATCEIVGAMDAVPAAVGRYLVRHDLPMKLVRAPAAELDAMPWRRQSALTVRAGRAEDGDEVALTPAFAGIAETGTLMLISGPETPTTLNFLAESHIVVLPESRILGCYEDGWALLREYAAASADGLPRTINLITGPSRTADIEHKLHMGAHGPARVHIVIVQDS